MNLVKRVSGWIWDFVVGDDWRLALGTVLAIGGTAVLVGTSVNAWWFMPLSVPMILGLSLRRQLGPGRR